MDGVFWHNDVGYVVDIHRMPSSFPDGETFGPVVLDDLIRAAIGHLGLGMAPLASWLVARLFHLTRERLGFETTTKLYNDGGGFYVNLIAFSRDLKPFAFFYVHGTSDFCRCYGQCARPYEAGALISSLVESLISEPKAVMKCHLTVVDTDPRIWINDVLANLIPWAGTGPGFSVSRAKWHPPRRNQAWYGSQCWRLDRKPVCAGKSPFSYCR